jgi:PKD repeat protein
VFTDASTDPDGNTTIASRSWSFGDGNTNTVDASPTHVYTEGGTKTVILTVRDDAGASDDFSKDVVVSATIAPTAAFTYLCNSLDCVFTDGSTDDGTITTYAWDFGDGATSDVKDPNHSFTAAATAPFNVKLTVTDDDGNTNSVTQVVTVTPPAPGQCDNGAGTFVNCTLDVTQKSHITVTMVSNSCTAKGNSLTISTTGFSQTLFSNGCKVLPGTVFNVNGANGTFAAGTQLTAQITSGSTDPGRVPPQLRVSGTFPTWRLEFDDGENPTGPGEPDFNDLVLDVNAEVRP